MVLTLRVTVFHGPGAGAMGAVGSGAMGTVGGAGRGPSLAQTG